MHYTYTIQAYTKHLTGKYCKDKGDMMLKKLKAFLKEDADVEKLQAVIDEYTKSVKGENPLEGRNKENYTDLCNIVELVKTGKADDVRRLAQKHVRRFNEYMMDHKHV